jgi:hypothetical protein
MQSLGEKDGGGGRVEKRPKQCMHMWINEKKKQSLGEYFTKLVSSKLKLLVVVAFCRLVFMNSYCVMTTIFKHR